MFIYYKKGSNGYKITSFIEMMEKKGSKFYNVKK